MPSALVLTTHKSGEAKRRSAPAPHPPWEYAALAAALMVVASASLFGAQELLWPNSGPPVGFLDHFVSWMTLFWAATVHVALFGALGLLLYRRSHSRPVPEPIEQLVCFRIVSRGHNAEALAETVRNVRATMLRLPLFRYCIEVVTDIDVPLDRGPDLVHLVVPGSYATARGSRYKARALQFALDRSDLPADAWIMHLDEESHISESVVEGIAAAVAEEESSGALRIGQGAILYHRHLWENTFLTLADSIRTGDDLGRFYLQHKIGRALFGFHGSFVLVRCDVEKQVGFDLGPKGSITEDAWWALIQMDKGRRCRWVDGFVHEQAPQSLWDFVKQRRRWFTGLVLCVLFAPVPWHHRAALSISVFTWSIAWLGIVATFLNLPAGSDTPLWLRMTANFTYAVYITYYVLGLKLNLAQLPRMSAVRVAIMYVFQVVLIPIFALMEAAGIVYAIVRPEFGFHVVKKSPDGHVSSEYALATAEMKTQPEKNAP